MFITGNQTVHFGATSLEHSKSWRKIFWLSQKRRRSGIFIATMSNGILCLQELRICGKLESKASSSTLRRWHIRLSSRLRKYLNSRPLSPMSADPANFTALTPRHFLISRPLLAPTTPQILDPPLALVNRWQCLKAPQQRFCACWKNYKSCIHARNGKLRPRISKWA